MDYELVLDHHYGAIAQDLDVYEIEDYVKELESNNILQPRDIRNIFNRDETNEDNVSRAKKLLDIFQTRLQSKIPGFIDHLKSPYPHLVEDFETDLKRIKSIEELPTTKKHIRRLEALQEIKLLLKVSTHFVVIKGFPGTGKTNIAVEAAMHFALKNSVYWVNAGGATGNQLKVLRMLLSRMKPKQENPDSLSDPEQLASLLKDLLKKDDVVILDNVSPEVDLSIFNSLPPKFIITTTDLAIMENLDSSEKIDVSQGFTKDESLKLISKVVQKDVDSLPPCVANIYKYFQGYPLAVTLIAGQLAYCNENQWAEFCQFSDDIDTGVPVNERRKSSDGVRVSIDSTMLKCIQSLSEENQYYYKMLAIFKDNVFLTTETLRVLWDCADDIKKVRTILNELEDKSMVIKNYKVSLATDVYEIHSTILNYLRRQQSEEDIKRMHESFVNNYLNLYKNIADITDDHYIFYYIIYHIISAGCLEKFRSELFNLDYIVAKLAACGPNDMAEDLKLYREALERVGFDKQRLDETAEFSEKFGWDIYHTKVKDLQFFLQMPENSLLFNEGMERCQLGNLLVFKSKWLTQRVTHKEYPFQSIVTKLFCLENNGILCEKWVGSEPSIVSVKLGDVKESVVANGSILCICVNSGNLLYKVHERKRNGERFEERKSAFLKQVGGGRTPDVTRQMNGDRSVFRPPSNGREISNFGDVSIAAFSQSGDKVVFVSNSEMGVYNLADDKVSLIQKTSDALIPTPALCCFSWVQSSEILMFATMAREIYFYQTSGLDFITKHLHPTKIVDMSPVPNKMQLLVLSDFSVRLLSWEHGPQTLWSSTSNRLTIGDITSKEIHEKSVRCLKCLVTSRWIAIATPNGCIVKENVMGKGFFKVGYGEVAALDIDDKDNTLTMITSRSRECKDISSGREENRRIAVYKLLELEHRPSQYLTDACHHWSLQKGHLLGIVEPGYAAFYTDKEKIFEAEIADPISIDMSLKGDIAVVGDAKKAVHFILPFKKKKRTLPALREAADFLKIDSSGKFIVAGSVRSHVTTFTIIFFHQIPDQISDQNLNQIDLEEIIASRKIVKDLNAGSPIFDCFFEEESSKIHLDADSNVKIVSVFKNGLHSVNSISEDELTLVKVYESSTGDFKYNKYEHYQATENSTLTCVAYHNDMLIKGIGTSLHVFFLKEDSHKSQDFHHRITSCCIEPCDSYSLQSAGDSSKPRVAVALATDDHRFQIVVCCKNLNELRRFYLDYAQEEVQQLVFSKSQTILMARCDWLCFWDMSDPYKSSSAKTSRPTLHPAWKTHPVPLDTKESLLARFKLQLEVLSLLPSEDFGKFGVVHKKGDRRILQVVDYEELSRMPRNGSYPGLHLDLKPQNGSL